MVEFFLENWNWFLLLFYILEKLVKVIPGKYDDIIVDIIINGVKHIVKGKK